MDGWTYQLLRVDSSGLVKYWNEILPVTLLHRHSYVRMCTYTHMPHPIYSLSNSLRLFLSFALFGINDRHSGEPRCQ